LQSIYSVMRNVQILPLSVHLFVGLRSRLDNYITDGINNSWGKNI